MDMLHLTRLRLLYQEALHHWKLERLGRLYMPPLSDMHGYWAFLDPMSDRLLVVEPGFLFWGPKVHFAQKQRIRGDDYVDDGGRLNLDHLYTLRLPRSETAPLDMRIREAENERVEENTQIEQTRLAAFLGETHR